MKKYLIIVLFIPFFVLGQNPINESLIKKYCELVNIERKHNEVINAMIYKSFEKEYPHLSYVDFQIKAESLYSEKQVLKNLWESYIDWGINDLTISHFKMIGFTDIEAENFMVFINDRGYLSDEELIELTKVKVRRQKIYEIEKKIYQLNELNPSEYQKIKHLLIKSISDYITEKNYDYSRSGIQSTSKGVYDITLYKRLNRTYEDYKAEKHGDSDYNVSHFIYGAINSMAVIDSLKSELLETDFGPIKINYAATYKDIPIYYTNGKIQVKKKNKGVIFIDSTSNQKLIKSINMKMKEYENGYYYIEYVSGNIDTIPIEKVFITSTRW